MSSYADLRARIDAREVIILDGAVGTQLQRMEVPMSHDAWAGIALETQSSTSVHCATHCPNTAGIGGVRMGGSRNRARRPGR